MHIERRAAARLSFYCPYSAYIMLLVSAITAVFNTPDSALWKMGSKLIATIISKGIFFS